MSSGSLYCQQLAYLTVNLIYIIYIIMKIQKFHRSGITFSTNSYNVDMYLKLKYPLKVSWKTLFFHAKSKPRLNFNWWYLLW